ncbi:hypothetical protein AB2L28_12030 [Kineococcus sp. TBRC 1896]|uniref:Secreted protein n=1 Tax=Kineococcus mangrovi TaxID=1660183 RepID=A0ABV4I2T3_9ACTN
MITRSRVTTSIIGAAVLSASVIVGAGTAQAASPAATAFRTCLNSYGTAYNYALKAGKDDVARAIDLTGLANCNYELSQRSDITDTQEINAINNYNRYAAAAKQAITKAGLKETQKILTKYALKGLRL